jgi:hypothetical protein
MNFFKDDEDQPMEQMLAVSMLNLQLDMLAKKIEKREIPFKSIAQPSQLSCLGFQLQQPKLNFFNKFMTIDSDYITVKPSDNCEDVEDSLKKEIMKQLSTIEGGINKGNFKQIIMDKAAEAREEMKARGQGTAPSPKKMKKDKEIEVDLSSPSS